MIAATLALAWALMPGAASGAEGDSSAEVVTLRKLLENSGLSAEAAAEFVAAFEKAQSAGKLEPLTKWVSHSDERVALIAAAGYFGIDPERAEEKVLKLVEGRKSPNPSHVLALGMTQKKEVIDLLIQRAAETKDPTREPALIALQIRTGKPFSQSSEWVYWWKVERERFKGPPVSDPSEFMQRLHAIRLGGILRGLGQSLKDSKAADATKGVSAFFQQMADGHDMEFSEETLRGVDHFCRGEFAEALAAYEEALKVDQFDRIALLDAGCLLLEEGRFDEATKAFARLDALIPGSSLISDLRKFAEDRTPKEDWLGTLRRMPGSNQQKEDLRSEPLTSFLMSRSMSKAKIEIPKDVIEELLGDSARSFPLQLGAALASSKLMQAPRLALVRTRFPESPVANAWTFLSTAARKDWEKDRLDACSRWAAMEPANVVPKVGLVALQANHSNGDQPTPIIGDALLRDLEQALAAPELNFRLTEAADAVRRTIEEVRFPFPAVIPTAGSELSGFLLAVTRGVRVKHGDHPQRAEDSEAFTRHHQVSAILSKRFPPEMFPEGIAKMAASSLAIYVLELEKTLIKLKDGSVPAIEAIDQRKQALNSEARAFGKNPDLFLRALPLPSMQRALYDGE